MTGLKQMTGALALAASVSIVLAAQQPPAAQGPTFRTGTQIVSLFVTVADASRRLVPGLTQEEFEVFDNDKPQPIVFFQNEVQPITVVVMLDTSGSMTLTLDLLRDGGRTVPHPAAARGQGPRRRVQRQDSVQRAVHRAIATSSSPT